MVGEAVCEGRCSWVASPTRECRSLLGQAVVSSAVASIVYSKLRDLWRALSSHEGRVF